MCLVGVPAAMGARPASAQATGSVRYTVVPERSEARYRVREQLVGVTLPNDAVGTTHAVAGAITFDALGGVVSSQSRFTVDLRTLTSDEPRRDNFLRRNTLQTDRYPLAVFVPTEVRGLQFPLPQTGTATFEMTGDFTIRETTRRTTWQASATFKGAEVDVRADTAVRFADLGLEIPRVRVVLSVEDNIRLELDLGLRR
ncbi:MAG TPA: YceI family protein [Methylomirabilota bacterium]|jgi:polyisoprenoid-binding protein YceI|nr:YceI family protein [Methylomirabilota bacterium]